MTSTEKQIVRVALGPVLVDGGYMRLVEFADGSGQVQSLVYGNWQQGGGDAKDVLTGTPAADPLTGAPPITSLTGAPPIT